ncbi:MAG TPA: hypothetical protein VFZ93_05865 [Albitalea sp.]
MNAPRERLPESDNVLVDLVDFKWLMAGDGWWVDVPRLRRDAAYAGQCLRAGLASGSDVVRRRAVAVLPFVAGGVQS